MGYFDLREEIGRLPPLFAGRRFQNLLNAAGMKQMPPRGGCEVLFLGALVVVVCLNAALEGRLQIVDARTVG